MYPYQPGVERHLPSAYAEIAIQQLESARSDQPPPIKPNVNRQYSIGVNFKRTDAGHYEV